MNSVTNLFDCPSCFVCAVEVILINNFIGLLNFTGVGVEWKQLPCIFTGGLARVMNEQLSNYTLHYYNLLFLSVNFFSFFLCFWLSFIQKSYSKTFGYQQTFPDMSEAEVLSSIVRGHDSMMAVLTSRQRSLQIIYSLWHNKDLKVNIVTIIWHTY